MIAIYIRLPYKYSNSERFSNLSNSEGILAVFPPLRTMFSSSEIVLKMDGIISIIPSTKQSKQH